MSPLHAPLPLRQLAPSDILNARGQRKKWYRLVLDTNEDTYWSILMEHDDFAASADASNLSGASDQFESTISGGAVVATEAPEELPTDTPLDNEVARAEGRQDEAASSEMLQAVARLATDMSELRRDFDTKIKYDQSKDRLLDTLHAELQTHREGLTFRILRPVLLDLISLYDDLASLAVGLPDAVTPTRSPGTVAQEGIVEILEHNGANAYVAVAGEAVVSSRQRTINVVATDNPTQNGTVAHSLRPGFEYEGRVLRPEWIEVYRYSAPQQDTTPGGDQGHV